MEHELNIPVHDEGNTIQCDGDDAEGGAPDKYALGAGRIIVLAEQCLRCAKQPTDCAICITTCPVDAFAMQNERLTVTDTCIGCGICLTACPTAALASTNTTSGALNQTFLRASKRVKRLVITCACTQLSKQSDHLVIIPCLGSLTTEQWFSLLNERERSFLDEVLVYLPSGQCRSCPVNIRQSAEELFTAAISEAEQWTNTTIGLIDNEEELPDPPRQDMLDYLHSTDELDRRGAFSGLIQQAQRTWDDIQRGESSALLEVHERKERVRATLKTRLSENRRINAATLKSRNAKLTDRRHLLIESLGRNTLHADDIILTISMTDDQRCALCKTCIAVCPLGARTIWRTEKGTDSVRVDALYCTGCSACIQACPEGACHFTTCTGRDFLVS